MRFTSCFGMTSKAHKLSMAQKFSQSSDHCLIFIFSYCHTVVVIDKIANELINVNASLQLMDELELILADTANEELTPEKKIQYNTVSCSL